MSNVSLSFSVGHNVQESQFYSGDYCHVTKKHALALLFMIFALATLFDMKMPPYSAEALEYFALARIALRWAPPSYDTTLAAIQAMASPPFHPLEPLAETYALPVVYGTIS